MDIQNYTQNQTPVVEKSKMARFLPLAILVIIVAGFFVWYKIPTRTENTENLPVESINPELGKATLSWNANTESDLAGYRIYYGISTRTGDCPPGGYSGKKDVVKTDTPDRPSFTLYNLEKDKTYYFSISSYDISGNESCFSSEMSKAIK